MNNFRVTSWNTAKRLKKIDTQIEFLEKHDADSMSGMSIDISKLSRDRKKFIMDNCSEGFCAATLKGVAKEVDFSQGLVVTEVSKIKKPSLFSLW